MHTNKKKEKLSKVIGRKLTFRSGVVRHFLFYIGH